MEPRLKTRRELTQFCRCSFGSEMHRFEECYINRRAAILAARGFVTSWYYDVPCQPFRS